MKQALATCLVALSTLCFAGTGLQAQVEIDAETRVGDLPEKLLAEGWQEAAPGVFKRQRPGQPEETLALGREGLEWSLDQLEGRLALLVDSYRKAPSAQLEEAVNDLRLQIQERQQALDGFELDLPVQAAVDCDISFGCAANAYPLSGSLQGVGANSSAYFNNNCAHQASVTADAYGSTASGSDYAYQNRPGANVSASAAITVPGGYSCLSDALSTVYSSGLGIDYFCYDDNYACPAPPLQLNVYGSYWAAVFGYQCKTLSWSASASGGYPPYWFSWWIPGYTSGSGTSASLTVCGWGMSDTEQIEIQWTVFDSLRGVRSQSFFTTVNYIADDCLDDPFAAAVTICPLSPE